MVAHNFVSLWMLMMISEVGNQVQYLMHQTHEIMHLSREVCRLRFKQILIGTATRVTSAFTNFIVLEQCGSI